MKAIEKERLGERGEEHLIEYFVTEFNPSILSEGFQL